MAKKHNKAQESQQIKYSQPWVIGVVVLSILVIIVWGRNTLWVKSIFNKFTVVPTPTHILNISPPARLSTDQASYVNLARETLAEKLRMKTEDIKVVSVKEEQWNDSSLGCPQRGMMYIQSITPGYVIELFANGKTYYYNGGLNRVVSC